MEEITIENVKPIQYAAPGIIIGNETAHESNLGIGVAASLQEILKSTHANTAEIQLITNPNEPIVVVNLNTGYDTDKKKILRVNEFALRAIGYSTHKTANLEHIIGKEASAKEVDEELQKKMEEGNFVVVPIAYIMSNEDIERNAQRPTESQFKILTVPVHRTGCDVSVAYLGKLHIGYKTTAIPAPTEYDFGTNREEQIVAVHSDDPIEFIKKLAAKRAKSFAKFYFEYLDSLTKGVTVQKLEMNEAGEAVVQEVFSHDITEEANAVFDSIMGSETVQKVGLESKVEPKPQEIVMPYGPEYFMSNPNTRDFKKKISDILWANKITNVNEKITRKKELFEKFDRDAQPGTMELELFTNRYILTERDLQHLEIYGMRSVGLVDFAIGKININGNDYTFEIIRRKDAISQSRITFWGEKNIGGRAATQNEMSIPKSSQVPTTQDDILVRIDGKTVNGSFQQVYSVRSDYTPDQTKDLTYDKTIKSINKGFLTLMYKWSKEQSIIRYHNENQDVTQEDWERMKKLGESNWGTVGLIVTNRDIDLFAPELREFTLRGNNTTLLGKVHFTWPISRKVVLYDHASPKARLPAVAERINKTDIININNKSSKSQDILLTIAEYIHSPQNQATARRVVNLR